MLTVSSFYSHFTTWKCHPCSVATGDRGDNQVLQWSYSSSGNHTRENLCTIMLLLGSSLVYFTNKTSLPFPGINNMADPYLTLHNPSCGRIYEHIYFIFNGDNVVTMTTSLYSAS